MCIVLFKKINVNLANVILSKVFLGELILGLKCGVIRVVEKQHLESSFQTLKNEVLAKKEMLTKNLFVTERGAY